MSEQLRKSHLSLHLPASPAVGATQATFLATHPARITSAQLALSDSGVGSGGTTVVVKLNGVALTTQAALTVPVGASVNATHSKLTGTATMQSYPGGVRINPGDKVTVDVTAVPGTTAPKVASVILSLTQLDV